MSPKEVIVSQTTGRISHLVLARTEQDETSGEWKIDEEETLKKAFIMSYKYKHEFLGYAYVRHIMQVLDKALIAFCLYCLRHRDATLLFLPLDQLSRRMM